MSDLIIKVVRCRICRKTYNFEFLWDFQIINYWADLDLNLGLARTAIEEKLDGIAL